MSGFVKTQNLNAVLVGSDSGASSASQGSTNEVAKFTKGGNLAADILLNIIEKAMFSPEDEETFSLHTYGPHISMLHPDHRAHLRQYSAVNHWWHMVLCDIRPRDIECQNSQYFGDALASLNEGKISSVRTVFWDRWGSAFWCRYPVRLQKRSDDTSTAAARTRLFELFLQRVDRGMRDLILLGLELEPSLNVNIYGGWQRVKHFHYGFETLAECLPVTTALLRVLRNLESLYLENIFGQCALALPERPTYSLKSFEIIGVENARFAEWTGGDSRETLRELSWGSEDETDEMDDMDIPGCFKEDLSDVFPGDNTLFLRRLRVTGQYVRVLQHCNLEALRWLDISIDTEYSITEIEDCLANCKNLERIWVEEDGAILHMVVAHLIGGGWPALEFMKLTMLDDLLSDGVLPELRRVCKDRGIMFMVGALQVE